MSNDNGDLLPKINGLVPIYEKVKEAIFLAEYEGDMSLPLASINELRNCLDHLMRACVNNSTNNNDHEFIEAKAHLYRAGNDSYEILIMHKMKSLDNFQRQFDKEAIKEIFPDYYQVILPLVSKAKVQLSKQRAKKPIMHEEENTFQAYEDIAASLITQMDLFEHNSIGIIQYEKAMKRKNIRGKIIDYAVGGLIVGLIILLIDRLT